MNSLSAEGQIWDQVLNSYLTRMFVRSNSDPEEAAGPVVLT